MSLGLLFERVRPELLIIITLLDLFYIESVTFILFDLLCQIFLSSGDVLYTVNKGERFSRPQPGCHRPNSSWAGTI